jgi:hypothetical protein
MNIRTIAAAALLAATSFAARAEAPPAKAYHLYIPGRKPIRQPIQTSPTMLYFAGPVIAKVRVVAVMWNSSVNATVQSKISGFYKAIVNSTFVDQLAQYDTNIVGVNGMQGTNQSIVRGAFAGKVVITPANKSKTLTDAQVQTELLAQIKAGNLPKNNLNTLYMIYFPPGISINLDGALSCQSFGAYHFATSTTVSKSNVFYGVMPDCGYTFNDTTIVSSHEYAEATTDAIPTPGSNPAFPQAWNDANGNEIGDLCEGTAGTLTAKKATYYVQEVFLNSTNACGTGNFHSP